MESLRPSCRAVNSLLGRWGRDSAGVVPGPRRRDPLTLSVRKNLCRLQAGSFNAAPETLRLSWRHLVPSLPGPEAQDQPGRPQETVHCGCSAGARGGQGCGVPGKREQVNTKSAGSGPHRRTPCAGRPLSKDKPERPPVPAPGALSRPAGTYVAAPLHVYFLPPLKLELWGSQCQGGIKTSKEASRYKTKKRK